MKLRDSAIFNINKICWAIFLLNVIVLFSSHYTFAQDHKKMLEEISEKARGRFYPGGNEEDSLRVKEDLEEPEININKASVDEEVLNDQQNTKQKPGSN
jgi:hypothetical protein